jgi:hypothetical protein
MVQPMTLRDTTRVEAVELDLAAAPYPDLAQAHAYWDRQRGGRFAPRRADIDPADLVHALPRIMLADVLPEPLDFRYRLCGTGITNVHLKNMTGMGPRDLLPEAYAAMIHQHYCEAVRRRAPLLHLIVLDIDDRARSYARLLLPLSEDGSTVTMLMAIDSKEQDTKALKDYFAAIMRASGSP